MKQILRFMLPVLLLPLLTSCPLEVDPLTYSEYKPILMSRSQLEKSIVLKQAQPLVNTGKLYQYGQYILINEQFKGVHVINNINPTAPQHIGFIQVPGSVDMAIKNNVLYVDNAVDLVSISLDDLKTIQVTKRIRNAFPELVAPDNLPLLEKKARPENAIIVGWENLKKE